MEGNKTRWEGHNQVKVGGKEKNREKGDNIWLEQSSQITNLTMREIGESYLTKYIANIPSSAGYKKRNNTAR